MSPTTARGILPSSMALTAPLSAATSTGARASARSNDEALTSPPPRTVAPSGAGTMNFPLTRMFHPKGGWIRSIRHGPPRPDRLTEASTAASCAHSVAQAPSTCKLAQTASRGPDSKDAPVIPVSAPSNCSGLIVVPEFPGGRSHPSNRNAATESRRTSEESHHSRTTATDRRSRPWCTRVRSDVTAEPQPG